MTRCCEWCGREFAAENPRKRFCLDSHSAASRVARKRERDRHQLAEVARLLTDLCERADEAGNLVADGDAEPWRALDVLSEAVAIVFVPQFPTADVRALREGASPWVPA